MQDYSKTKPKTYIGDLKLRATKTRAGTGPSPSSSRKARR